MKKAFRIHTADNVATMLVDAAEEEVEVTGVPLEHPLRACRPVRLGHKIAVCDIASGSDIRKYGIAIGKATDDIRVGEPVHLHNCRSQFDERSSTLDRQTGFSQDVQYE